MLAINLLLQLYTLFGREFCGEDFSSVTLQWLIDWFIHSFQAFLGSNYSFNKPYWAILSHREREMSKELLLSSLKSKSRCRWLTCKKTPPFFRVISIMIEVYSRFSVLLQSKPHVNDFPVNPKLGIM